MDNNLSPQQIESSWMTSLEDANNRISAELNRISPQGQRLSTPAELAAIIQYIQQCENYLRSTYEQAGLRLNQLGYPALFQRIQIIVNDLRGAENIYKEMHTSALANEEKLRLMQQEYSQEWAKTVQESINRRQEMFDKTHKQWSANFTESCVHCGYWLGDAYYNFEICPKCGRLLRGAI